jgi:hypothetical protein
MSNVKVAGYKELIFNLKRIEQEAPVAFAFGAYEGLSEIMVDAKNRAPKDTETMAKSGYVAPPAVANGQDVTLEAGFGGGSAEYLVSQHEDSTIPHPNGGEHHFFSNAIDAGRGNLLTIIKRHVQAFLKTGRTTPVPKKVPATPWEG